MEKLKFIGMIILAILSIIYALKTKQVTNVLSLINVLAIKARDLYNSNEGQQKFNYVLKMVKAEVPFPFKILISEKLIKSMIQATFDNILKDDFYKTEKKQIYILDKVESLVKTNPEPMKLLTEVTKMKDDIKYKGYLEGFIESDLKDTKVGLKGGLKF